MPYLSTEERKVDDSVNLFLMFGIIVFSIGTFTLETFLSSSEIKILYIFSTIILLFIYYLLSNERLYFNKVEPMFFLFLVYFVINILIHGITNIQQVGDLFVFMSIVLLLILLKVNVNYFMFSIRIMLVLSITYALGSIFQFTNMELYSKIILSKFNDGSVKSILRLYHTGRYAGFTYQTAYTAGYLVFGIGIASFMYKMISTKFMRILIIITIPLMTFSLLLSTKRAHLLFMIISLILTYLFSVEIKKVTSRLIKISVGLMLFVISLFLILYFYEPNVDSVIGKVFYRFNLVFENLIVGEDFTNGRSSLYKYALELFLESPIFGIGWRGFQDLTLGFVMQDIASHPHNIYIQLLTELGIVGFLLFVTPMLYVLIKTVKLLTNFTGYFAFDPRWQVVLQFSLFTQFFFILYGITGNGLTDHIFLIMYGFAITITLSSIKYAAINCLKTRTRS